METIKLIAMDMDGTLLLDGGKGIPAENIADDAARRITAIIREEPVHYGIFSDHALFISTPMSEKLLKLIFGDNILRQGSRTRLTFEAADVEELLAQGVNKFMIFTDNSPETLQALRERIERDIPGVDVSSSWHNNLEVNASGANKGVALRALADALNIPLSQVMAIGDNDNDLPMLEAAGVSVAMGNASPAVKAQANNLTLPNHACGVAAAIRAIALGQVVPDVRRLK